MYIVITGTSRGIGLGFTELALSLGHHVLAVARNPESSELLNLKKKNDTLEILALDVVSHDAPQSILKKITHWPQIDVLINNAGIYEKDESFVHFEKSFLTNTIAPFFLTRGLFEKLKKSPKPLSLQISSLMGSIEDNTSGGSYSYRASKTALNMLYKGLSVDEKWLTSILVHPGWVQTDMGGKEAPVSPKQSVQGMWKIIENAQLSQSGSFLDYQARLLPW